MTDEKWSCPFCGLGLKFVAEDSPCYDCASEYRPRNAGIYYQVQFLRDHFIAEDPDLTYLGKEDPERLMLILQKRIEDFLGRELVDSELDYLV